MWFFRCTLGLHDMHLHLLLLSSHHVYRRARRITERAFFIWKPMSTCLRHVHYVHIAANIGCCRLLPKSLFCTPFFGPLASVSSRRLSTSLFSARSRSYDRRDAALSSWIVRFCSSCACLKSSRRCTNSPLNVCNSSTACVRSFWYGEAGTTASVPHVCICEHNPYVCALVVGVCSS